MKKAPLQACLILGIFLFGNLIAYKLIHVPMRLELVGLFSLILFYPILRNPLVGVYAMFIILPFIPHLRRLYYLLYSRPSLDPLIIIGDILIVFILIGLFFEFKEHYDRYRPVRAYIVIIICYFLYMLARVFVFNSQQLSESASKFKLYGPPVLSFLVGLAYSTRISHLKRIWVITIVTGIIAGLYGIKQLYVGYSEAEKIWFNTINFTTLFIKGVARPFSFFQAPVAFADYQQLAIIGVLILSSCKVKFSKAFLILIPFFFYATLITSVRSSWIGIMATFIIWITLFHVKGNKNRILLLSSFALCLALGEIIFGTLSDGLSLGGFINLVTRVIPNQKYIDLLVINRTTALENPLSEHSLLSRFMLWKYILASSAEPIKAILGRGLGTLKADSLYMTYLAEFGYPGLLFIIIMIGTFIKKGLHLMDTTRNLDVGALAKGITIMNMVFALISVTGTHIHYFPGDIYFWFWNGVLVMLSANQHEKETEIQHENLNHY
ncbi:MAG: hypothetical protein ACLFSB_01060 [Chitinispirillaceae bacterium]